MAYLKKLNSVNSIELTATSATGGFIKQTHPTTSGGYEGTHTLLHTWAYGASNQMAASNLFVGQKAGNLLNTLTATQSVAVGEWAGNSLTSGAANTLVGWFAGKLLASGSGNVAVGKQSLPNTATSTDCTSVGALALSTLTSGTQLTAIGSSALSNLQSGSCNTALGKNSGIDTPSSGSVTIANNCTFLGGFASTDNATTSTFRTSVGARSICTHDNAIKLGRDAIGSGNGTTSNEAGDVTIISSFNNTQRGYHASPVNGSIIYNSGVNEFQVYVNGAWSKLVTTNVS